MKYFVQVNGRPHEVEVVAAPGGLAVRIDGEELDVAYTEVDRLGQVAMLVDGRSYGVSIDGDETLCSVTVAGHLYEVAIEDERERAAHAAERARKKGGGTVNSVMPGVVVTVLVTEGELVEEGQALLILEAMKMQNEIAAPSAGRVERIHATEGRAVASGAPLITLASTEPDGE